MAMKTRRTAEQDERFFHILRHGAPVTVAAKAAGYKPNTLYRWRKLDPAFAARWRAVEREKASALDKTYRQVLEQLVRRGLHVPAEKQARHIGSPADGKGGAGPRADELPPSAGRERPDVAAAPPEVKATSWRPQPGPQTELIGCKVFEVFFGGARG